MAEYVKQVWKDAFVDDTGNVIEAGTLITKERMEHIEDGVSEVNNSLTGEIEERKNTMWNPNILYNSYFLNPVNQRSLLEYTTNGYTIDWWLLQKETATLPPILKITANGIEITAPADGNVVLEQVIEFPERYKKMPLTFSVKFSEKSQGNGHFTVYSHNGTIYETVTLNEAIPINHGGKIMSISGVGNEVMRQLRARIMVYRGTTLIVESAKLELGTNSTLANDPPQDYGTELAKCQRYQIELCGDKGGNHKRIGIGLAWLSTHCAIQIPIPVTMRTNPTAIMTGKFVLTDQASTFEVTAMSLLECAANVITLTVNVASGLIPGQVYALQANNDATAKLTLDANL